MGIDPRKRIPGGVREALGPAASEGGLRFSTLSVSMAARRVKGVHAVTCREGF